MDLNKEAVLILQDMAKSPDEIFYNDMKGLIQYQADYKEVNFLYLDTQNNDDVFSWLEYVWSLMHDEISQNIFSTV